MYPSSTGSSGVGEEFATSPIRGLSNASQTREGCRGSSAHFDVKGLSQVAYRGGGGSEGVGVCVSNDEGGGCGLRAKDVAADSSACFEAPSESSGVEKI